MNSIGCLEMSNKLILKWLTNEEKKELSVSIRFYYVENSNHLILLGYA